MVQTVLRVNLQKQRLSCFRQKQAHEATLDKLTPSIAPVLTAWNDNAGPFEFLIFILFLQWNDNAGLFEYFFGPAATDNYYYCYYFFYS